MARARRRASRAARGRAASPTPTAGRNEYDLRWVADRDWTLPAAFDAADRTGRRRRRPRRRRPRHGGRGPDERRAACSRRQRVPRASRRRSPTRVAPGENAHRDHLPLGARGGRRAAGRAALPRPLSRRQLPDPERQHAAQAALRLRLGLEHRAGPVRGLRPRSGSSAPRARIAERDPSSRSTRAGRVEVDGRRLRCSTPSRPARRGASTLCGETVDGAIESARRAFSTRARRSPTPTLWWPAGAGAQPLHDLTVERRRPRAAPADRACATSGSSPSPTPPAAASASRQRPRRLRPRRQLDPRRRAARPDHRRRRPATCCSPPSTPT